MSDRANSWRRHSNLLLAAVLLLTAIVFAPGYAGYWLSDDFNNLHRAYVWQINGESLAQLLRQFVSDPDDGAAFYRPLLIVSLTLDYLLHGSSYAGWYAHNHLLHLGNTLLVALLVRRIAAHAGADATYAAPLAAAVFALSPLLAEGVYWLSARSDASVTLLSLIGLMAWIGEPGKARAQAAWLPVLLLPALMFKESAALLPLQAGLLWLALPTLRERHRLLALVAAALAVGGFMAWRAYLFGNAWQVYGSTEASLLGSLARLPEALASALPWLQGLLGGHTLLIGTYIASLLAVLVVGTLRSQARLPALALFAAGGGAVLATLLNLGALVGGGEGGRLLYTPLAWLSIGLGVLFASGRRGGRAAASTGTASIESEAPRNQRTSVVMLAVPTLLGSALLLTLLAEVRQVQSTLRQIVETLPEFTEGSDQGTLLLLPDAVGPAVAGRNAQSAFVLQPLQEKGFIDRVLPALPGDLSTRHDQYADGLLDQLAIAQLQFIDRSIPLPPAPERRPRWPSSVACWSDSERRLIAFDAPDGASKSSWIESIEQAAQARDCWLR